MKLAAGTNVYQYVGSNPVLRLDPTGTLNPLILTPVIVPAVPATVVVAGIVVVLEISWIVMGAATVCVVAAAYMIYDADDDCHCWCLIEGEWEYEDYVPIRQCTPFYHTDIGFVDCECRDLGPVNGVGGGNGNGNGNGN